MTRGLTLIVAALVALAPLATRAQTTPTPEKDATQPSQGSSTPPAVTPAPAAKPPPPAVTVFGTLNINTQWTKANGLTSAGDVAPRYAVSIDSSNIGVRGGIQATDWARAEFQCETQASIDGLDTRALCNRNSRVGVSTPAGLFWMGNWDTPYKAATYGTKADDPFGNTDVFAFQGIMGSPGFGYRSSAWKAATDTVVHGFDVRASNSVGYWSPKYYGLSARLQYSTNEFKTPDAAISPKLYGAALIYDRGPFSVTAAYERHDDAFGLAGINGGTAASFGATAANTNTVDSEDWAWRVAAGYELNLGGAGATTLLAMFEELTFEQEDAAAGAVSEFSRWAWQVGAKHRIQNHEFRARYSMADEGDCDLVGGGACSTDEYGANMLAVGYAYHLAKTTQVYLHWSSIQNDDNAAYTFSIGGAPAVVAAARGKEPQALALGFRHAF